MHAYLIVGSTPDKQAEKVKELLLEFDVPEVDEIKTEKKHLIVSVRALNKKLLIPAIDPSKNRAVVIYDANLLTSDAANALLKTLEEPPNNTIFILTAPNSQSVLETISSRAQSIELTGQSLVLSDDDLKNAEEVFEKLISEKLADRMKILDEIKDREEGKALLLGQVIFARKLLNKNAQENKPNKQIIQLFERLEKCRQDLDTNVNTKIALCDLLLHYPRLS